MRDKTKLYEMFEDKLRERGSSLGEALNTPHLKVPVPEQAGQSGRYYHIVKDFALVVRSDTGEPMASVPTPTALLTLMRYAPGDAIEVREYLAGQGATTIQTLSRKDVYFPMDVDLSSPHHTQQYTDPLGTVWSISRTEKDQAAILQGQVEVGRYTTADEADNDHNLPIAVVNLVDEVLANS